eukprot:g1321.t1
MPEKRPLRRWEASWWMVPAWPIILVLNVWFTFVGPLLFGPYLLADQFELKGVRNQVWLSRAFGYQFMIKACRPRIARGIEATLREADGAGVSVLGLGALNKAEFVNRGGEDVLEAYTPRKTRLVHGNTLTAAVVVENVWAAIEADPTAAAFPCGAPSGRGAGGGNRPCVFLTGATSKVGRAVALKLALDGLDVVCCTSSDERFASLQHELSVLQTQQRQQRRQPASEGSGPGMLSRARRVDEGVHYKLWVVGKFDTSVRLHVPLNGSAIVFAVPCPLEGYRPDVSTVTGGIIRLDVASCTPRQFHVLLPHDQLYACHAAAIVHHRMGWTHHEVGKVDVGRMANILQLALECGFSVPFSRTPPPRPGTAAATCCAADNGVGGLRDVDNTGVGDTPRGFGGVRPSGRRGVENVGRLGGGEERGMFLPRPDGVSVTASGSSYGSGSVPTDGIAPYSPLAGRRSDDAGVGNAGGVSGTSEKRRPQQQGGVEEEGGRGRCEESRKCWMETVSRRRSSTIMQAGGEHGGVFGGTGATQAFDVGVQGVRVETVNGQFSEGKQLQRQLPPAHCRVVVVGAGASGLSAAACLRARGEDGVVVLERSDSVCGAWSRQYEGLRITTRRAHCGLPGWPVPRGGFCGKAANDDTDFTVRGGGGGGHDEMSAEGFVRYLRAYRRRFDLEVFTDTEVFSADGETLPDGETLSASWAACRRGGRAGDGGGIRVRYRRRGESNASVILCDHLVVATGKCSTPRMPAAVLQSLRGFSGEVLHSSQTSNLASRAAGGGGICIVGMGNSACDLAVALLANGADKVHISTRSAPPIIMREWGPLSLEWVSRATQFLPALVSDRVLSAFAAAKWGKGWRAKVFPPGVRQTWNACASNRIPCIDKGCLVKALLGGRIVVHGPVDWASGRTLRFQATGEFLAPSNRRATGSFDTVILATGFDSHAHQGWLDPALLAEGGRRGAVHTVGFDNGRALLPLRQIGVDARRVAARIAPCPPSPHPPLVESNNKNRET